MRKIIIWIVAALVASCTMERQGQLPKDRIFQVRFEASSSLIGHEGQNTKTGITGSSIHFEKGDRMTVMCEGYNSFSISNENTSDVTLFEGVFHSLGLSGKDCDWYSVFPSHLQVTHDGVISGILPETQNAPFDPNANIMFSDIVVADYDEETPPNLRFQMNQLMGLVRISFCNTEEEYKDDIIETVQLRSSTVLAGSFRKDMHSSELVFLDGGKKHVTSLFNTNKVLGLNQQHYISLFVNPAQIANATLIIRTDKHTFTYKSSKQFTPSAGTLTLLPLMDLADFSISGYSDLKRKVVCWGDSYTDENYTERISYCKYLQKLLGDEWIVYNGGMAGDRTYEIAARQGSVQLVTGSSFTIPSGTEKINIDGLLRTHDVLFTPGYFPLRRFTVRLTDPCKLIGTNGEEVLCHITSGQRINGTDTTYYATLNRVSAGDPIEIAAHTPVQTYAARELRDVDLTIIYMGTNGSFGSESDDNKYVYTRWDNLADQHWEMINFTTHPDSYIVLGRHNALSWDSMGYSAYMESQFGNRYLNLREPVVESEESIKQWLLYSGAYTSESEIPQSEINYSLDGNWPCSLWYNFAAKDQHPSEYGAKVIGKLVYDRMGELGYLD